MWRGRRRQRRPGDVLKQTFSPDNQVESGDVNASFELSLDSEVLQSVGVEGPFTGFREEPAPRFDLAVSYQSESGEQQGLDLIATEDSGYITIGGDSYAVDPNVFRRFMRGASVVGLEPQRWFIEPTNVGTGEVEGIETVHISGTANVERLLDDLRGAASGVGLRAGGLEVSQEFFDEATIDAFTGSDDWLLRRLELSLAWSGELEGGEPFQAAIDFSLSLAQVNEEQEVKAPQESRPIRELGGQLPGELSGLGEFLSRGG